jgi:hypothetical protein
VSRNEVAEAADYLAMICQENDRVLTREERQELTTDAKVCLVVVF